MIIKRCQQALNLKGIKETVDKAFYNLSFDSYTVLTIEGNEYILAIMENDTLKVVYKL